MVGVNSKTAEDRLYNSILASTSGTYQSHRGTAKLLASYVVILARPPPSTA